MTKEEWDKIEKKLQSPYGCVDLICDGYKLNLQVERDKMRLYIMTYIAGHFKGAWLINDCEERRRFFRSSVRKAFPPSMFKGFTKKELSYLKDRREQTITSFTPFWPSFRSLKAHLIKNNTSIELAPEV